jgi:DNA-binding transcriptional MerR regulator
MEAITSEGLTISATAEAAGISAHTLRYYERAGLIDPVERATSGHRRYAEDDLARIRFIGYLRRTRMPISRIREYFDLVREGESTEPERLELLLRHREDVLTQLEETQDHLAAINRKIEIYKNGGLAR